MFGDRVADYSSAIALSEEKAKLVTEKLERQKKRRNNGTNKYEQADSGIHDTLTHS